VLTDLGVAEPDRLTVLVPGVLGAGVLLVTHGSDPRVVAADVYQLLTRGMLP